TTLTTRDCHLATNNPPLPYVFEAVPLLFTSARIETVPFVDVKSVWRLAQLFVESNWQQFHHYCQLARAVSVGFLALTVILAYGLARSLYGPVGGLLTAWFVCFCAN